jgi:UDP-N-acetyl-D-glucosamine/UDP-N-acetyl-D-galactosamine dehydrogenase
LALIFDRLNISTKDVLAAARTKWNFLNFVPGLVGGHCIGVDPYYLTHKAQQAGYHPDVILAGRRVNDSMGAFIAGKTIKLLASRGISPLGAKVGVLGLTFKEDVPDLRNSRVPDIIKELHEYGVQVEVHDPVAPPAGAKHEYDLELLGWEQIKHYDAVILAVSHNWYLSRISDVVSKIRENGILVDVKGVVSPDFVREDIGYWTL